jgi:PLP dependent protein
MNYQDIRSELEKSQAVLLAVSKTKPVEQIMQLYNQGQRIFGENKVQELIEKRAQMPTDITWHLIGHLQTNKVKSILPHVGLIHGVDSVKLLKEINKEANKLGINSAILLQVFIATEESKFGLDKDELSAIITDYNNGLYPNVTIQGLMGMASFTDNVEQIRNEFRGLKKTFDEIKSTILKPASFNTVSMGMSGDYRIAVEEGSTMVRIGSLLFGAR